MYQIMWQNAQNNASTLNLHVRVERSKFGYSTTKSIRKDIVREFTPQKNNFPPNRIIYLFFVSASLTKCWVTAFLRSPPICHFTWKYGKHSWKMNKSIASCDHNQSGKWVAFACFKGIVDPTDWLPAVPMEQFFWHCSNFFCKFCIIKAFWQHKIDIKRIFKCRSVSNWK